MKKTLCALLSIIIVIICGFSVYANGFRRDLSAGLSSLGSENHIPEGLKKAAITTITKQYQEFYTIENEKLSFIKKNETSNNVEYYATVEFDRILKANDANELPYVRGCIETIGGIRRESDEYAALLDYIDRLTKELNEEYIGHQQKTAVPICIELNKQNRIDKSQYTVYVLDINDKKISPESLSPGRFDEIYKKGSETICEMIEEIRLSSLSNRTINPDIVYYDRVDARDYARNWSCIYGYNYDHASCHNTSYSFYNIVDCANFVSQCFEAGGLLTDSTWYVDSSAWIGVTALCNYVTSNNLFAQSNNDNKAFAGSIIRWTGDSHVGLVDQNDTVTKTFCAHTACRNSCPWTGESVYFYIPYWDSYSNSWTNLS